MSETNLDLDRVRRAALERMERSERNVKLAIIAGVVWEAVFLVLFLTLMDRHNRSHVLLFVATVGSYTLIVLGLVALGAFVDRSVLRVLKALEMAAKE
jgi:small-conductance mechanosensitive channel